MQISTIGIVTWSFFSIIKRSLMLVMLHFQKPLDDSFASYVGQRFKDIWWAVGYDIPHVIKYDIDL